MTDLQIGDTSMGITISILGSGRADPEGWVTGVVAIKIGVWSGRYGAQFHGTDFSRFAKDLAGLSSRLAGTAVLSSTDGYLDLTLTGDGLGHITVAGSAWDRPKYGTHLEVSHEIDQTYLPALIASAESIQEQLGPFEPI
jgi:hypothetical protein